MIENKLIRDNIEIKDFVIEGIREKKGHHTVIIDLSKISNSICDYFIICHGNSRTQVEAIAQSVEELVRKNAVVRPWHKEGWQNAEWILLDYVDVVVHVFNEKTRSFYNLEGLWADAPVTKIED
jgi:ribosome-associated protein